MNYFRAKPEFIISNYIIARETGQPAMKYPLLSVFLLRVSLIMSVMNSLERDLKVTVHLQTDHFVEILKIGRAHV